MKKTKRAIKHIRRLTKGLALLLAAETAFLSPLVVTAAQPAQAEEAAAPDIIELPAQEEVVATQPAYGTTVYMEKLTLAYGKPYSEGTGLQWDGKGNLKLNNYNTTKALYLYVNEKGVNLNSVVTVTGDCTVGMIEASAFYDHQSAGMTETDVSSNSLTICGGGTLRIRHTGRLMEGTAMVYAKSGPLLVEDVTMDMVSTSDEGHGHGFEVAPEYEMTIRRCNISMTLHSDDSCGMWNTYGKKSITVEDSKLHIHGTNESADSYTIWACGDLILKNVDLKVTGRIMDGISSRGKITADHLKLNADMTEIAGYGPRVLDGSEGVMITDSEIHASGVGTLLAGKNLTLINTVVDGALNDSVSILNTASIKGIRGIYSTYSTPVTFQSCDINLRLTNATAGSDYEASYALSGYPVTLNNTKLKIAVNMTASNQLNAGIIVGGGEKGLICKGTTQAEVTSTGHALEMNDEGALRLYDSLAVLTPGVWSTEERSIKSSEYGYRRLNIMMDQNGVPAKTLKIGKGSGTGTGNGTGTGSGNNSGGSTGNTGTGVWKQSGEKWWYRNADGSYPKSAWQKIDGKWYYFDASGYMQTGWIKVSGKWYYLKKSGEMQTGWLKQGSSWYYLNSGGDMATGWVKAGGKWYYMNGSGVMQTGWVKVSGKWYYMNGSGAMQTGWVKVSGKWYYMNGSGAMQTGWVKVSGKWYYMNGSGVMQTGWLRLSGKWYYLDSSGIMLANTSRKIGSKTYHFDAGGVCTNP